MVRRHWYGRFKSRRRIAVIFFAAAALIIIAVLIDLRHSDKKTKPTSAVQNIEIVDPVTTFTSDFFRFADTGKWVLNKQESTASKFIYYKYHGADIQQQLIVYVNQVPIALYLASSRVLPVRIVNSNSFDTTGVSGPCLGSYAAGELHKVKLVNINGANMLCDPDTPQYTIELAEVNGDYQLDLKRNNGTPVSFVITFRDLRFQPTADSILRIAKSFHSL